ncbi:unnamed protein product [Arabidopsis thaliana]|uniref:FBD domain-containing protein n=1 Tax=Arabidopsis thaliana TaxID=3702 RepID=A0A5S9Y904_ARATH|nr:unnamed protein product [Arabidopsis thaliana]
MENLFEARISLLVVEGDISRVRALINNDLLEDDEYDVLQFENVWKLMNGIRNIRCLYLSPNTLEVLSLCCESMPVFKNLKSLSIKSAENRGWQALPVLLSNCPYLETLVLEGLLHYVTDKCGDACCCVSREDKGRSLTSCPVKVIEIKGFQGKKKEMHMIKHFLVYSPCLKEIKIYIEENALEVSKVIAKRINRYNKVSNCNVQLLRRWIMLAVYQTVFFVIYCSSPHHKGSCVDFDSLQEMAQSACGDSPIKKLSKFRTGFDSHRADGWISNTLCFALEELVLFAVTWGGKSNDFLLKHSMFRLRRCLFFESSLVAP